MNLTGMIAAILVGTATTVSADPMLENVKWLWLPETEGVFYPPLTIDQEFVGDLEFECRIRDDEGHVDCDVPEIDPDYLYIAEHAVKIVEGAAQVDMKATPGAAIGQRVRLKLRFT